MHPHTHKHMHTHNQQNAFLDFLFQEVLPMGTVTMRPYTSIFTITPDITTKLDVSQDTDPAHNSRLHGIGFAVGPACEPSWSDINKGMVCCLLYVSSSVKRGMLPCHSSCCVIPEAFDAGLGF